MCLQTYTHKPSWQHVICNVSFSTGFLMKVKFCVPILILIRQFWLEFLKIILDKVLLHSAISPKITCWTYCAPGSGPPLVVCWGHIPAVVPRMASWVLWISVGLVIDALTVVDRGTGCRGTLLFCRRLLIRVTERLVHWLVVVRADHLPGDSSRTTCHWTLGTENQGVKNWSEGGGLSISQANNR